MEKLEENRTVMEHEVEEMSNVKMGKIILEGMKKRKYRGGDSMKVLNVMMKGDDF